MLRRVMNWAGRKLLRQDTVMSQMLDARRSLMSGGGSVTIPVNEKTAMRFSAVFASVRIISETKASLPIDVFERTSGKDVEVKQHPVAALLQYEPDPDFTPMVWGEVRQAHLCLFGNTYAELEFEGRTPEVVRAIPRAPFDVEPFRGEDGKLYYRVQDQRGGVRTLDQSQMLHVPGFGFNGIVGMSVIRHFLGDTIGVGLAADKFVASFYNNSGRPSIVIEVPNMLDDQGYQRLKKGVEQQLQNPFKPLLLEHGGQLKQWSMPLAEAQLLESRKFQGEEVAARGFRLPPHVAGYLDNAKFNNIESQDRYFEKHTMRPWFIRDEQCMNKALFRRADRGRFYVKYNSDAILRGDIKTRYDAYRLALLAGWRTINEVRSLEDLEPMEGGDVLPKPAAIWGKQEANDFLSADGQATSVAGEGNQRIDPRLAALTTQTIRGLFHREAVQLKRLANKPQEFRQAVEAFYDRHTGIVQEKLGALSRSSEKLGAIAAAHRQQILDETKGASNLHEAIQRCVNQWDAAPVAESLLMNSYEELSE